MYLLRHERADSYPKCADGNRLEAMSKGQKVSNGAQNVNTEHRGSKGWNDMTSKTLLLPKRAISAKVWRRRREKRRFALSVGLAAT